MSDNPVVHFEMPYKDAKRVTNFYKQAFGWGMDDMGGKMGNYIIAITADTDENRMNKTPGTINGGFYDLSDAPDSQEPSVVISVKDINKAAESIKQAGGEILRGPMEIPGIGQFIACRDTEGNRVGVLQPNPRENA